jgi:hypothetical protein
MQRHFSNRGEALAEVSAARVLAGRKTSAKSSFVTQAGRRGKPEQWFSQHPVEVTSRPKRKQTQRNKEITICL